MFTTQDLLRVRSGAFSFDEMARQARPDFIKLAHRVMMKRNVPVWIDVEDVAHTMLMSVPQSLRVWREGDFNLKRFVVFRACAAGRKFVARAQAYRDFEARVEAPEELCDAIQDRVFETHERALEMMELLPRTPMQRAVMQSLLHTMSVDRSVQDLIKDPKTRVMFAAVDSDVRLKVRRVMAILAPRAEEIQQAK